MDKMLGKGDDISNVMPVKVFEGSKRNSMGKVVNSITLYGVNEQN